MLNLDKNKKYLLACSFGPDSMALFDMLFENSIPFDVAHVNYHLREESDNEERLLKEYCSQKSIKLYVHNVDKKIDKNIEAICREIRYSFFANLYLQYQYDSILVAHNEDDLIETYLMQKSRKNLVKYFGIKEQTIIKGVPIRRPLLSYTKQQLKDYCDARNIPYSIDKTNSSRVFLRNRIRLDVVSKMNRSERDTILREISNENIRIQDIQDRVLKINNSVDALKGLDNESLAYYLDAKICRINVSYKLTHKCVEQVVNILHSTKPNISLTVGNKIIIKKEYDKLVISSLDDKVNDYIFSVESPMVIDSEYFYLDFTGNTTNRNVSIDDYPLTIRNYRKGDKYQIKDYSVLVRRLFIDWKMPSSLRKRWPIILNKDNKIIYIPRYQKDFVPDSSTNFFVK